MKTQKLLTRSERFTLLLFGMALLLASLAGVYLGINYQH
jgi:hypothetical protein